MNKEQIEQLYELALKSYKLEQVSPIEKYSFINEKVPDGFIFIERDNKIVGYIILLGLTESDYNRYKENKNFTEADICFDNICSIKDAFGVYFFSIIVDPDCKDKTIALKLIKELKRKSINKCLAITYSSNGEKLCDLFGFKQISIGSDGIIFEWTSLKEIEQLN